MGYLRNLISAIAGRPPAQATPQPPLVTAYGPDYQHRVVPNEQARGVRTPWVPVSLRWLPEDVEATWAEAEQGRLYRLASMIEGMRLNGTISGLMEKRSSIVRLPMVFSGDPFLCSQLRGVPATYTEDGVMLDPGVRGDFEIMCPPEALAELVYTGTMAGVAPFELVDDPATGLPVVTPRDLHFLRYDWSVRRWLFQGSFDTYDVDEGGGRWGLYSTGTGRPWKSGAWLPCALAFVAALAGTYDRMRWQALLADPLKWISAGEGANEAYLAEMQRFIEDQWQRAGGIALPKGYTAGITDAGGEGYKVYGEAEDRSDKLIQMALAGNTVSASGGSGFVNASVWDAIDETFIQKTASALARTVTRDLLPIWAHRRYSMRSRAPKASWDVRSPTRRRQDAEVLTAVANAITAADSMLERRGQMVDVDRYFAMNAIDLPRMAMAAPGALGPGPDSPTPLKALPPGQQTKLLPPAGEEVDDELEREGVDGPDVEMDAPQPDDRAALAEKMTSHGVDRCEHGRANRCPLCGIERERDFVPGVDGGEHQWRVMWRPIGTRATAGMVGVSGDSEAIDVEWEEAS